MYQLKEKNLGIIDILSGEPFWDFEGNEIVEFLILINHECPGTNPVLTFKEREAVIASLSQTEQQVAAPPSAPSKVV